jgi:hypothetical protein
MHYGVWDWIFGWMEWSLDNSRYVRYIKLNQFSKSQNQRNQIS